MITETDRAASAIDAVIAAQGGEITRAEALRFLLEQGISAVDPERLQLRTRRLKVLAEMKTSTAFSNTWPDNWKEEMLAEWPD